MNALKANLQTKPRDLYREIRIKQNLVAYGFLALPLILLAVFTFYPLIQGIYISFLDYQVLKSPTMGGPVAFTKAVLANLHTAQFPLLSLALFVLTIVAIVVMAFKKVSKRIILLSILALLIINVIPLQNVFSRSLGEINYSLEEDRTIANDMVPDYVAMLHDQYGKNALIVKEPVGKDETRVYIKRSIWVGVGNYEKILPNKEFVDFVRKNPWYFMLLVSPFLGFWFIYLFAERRKKNRGLDISLKMITTVAVVALIAVSWPQIFHNKTWQFYNAMENSLKYLLVVPPLQIASLLLAVLVNQKMKGITFFRTLYYIPVITGVVIIGYCWKFVYQPNGLLDSLLRMLHITNQSISWLGDPRFALYSIMFVTFWRGLGYYMILYLAGLQDISEELIEAAKIDGASPFHMITRIYMPLLRPTILVCTVLSTMAALRVFEEIFVLSTGSAATSPMNGTETMVYLIYDRAFGLFGLQFSYSAGLAVILSVIIGLFTILNFKLERGTDR